MNLAEKTAAAYLRLNGFLLLPHFTVFDGCCHGHVDLVGLRAAGSKEESGGITFLVDDRFFGAIKANLCINPRFSLIGVVAEVRTNPSVDEPKVEQQDYVNVFLGGAPVVPVAFFESAAEPFWPDRCLKVGNSYALKWIIERIQWMDKSHRKLTRSGSWPWSDDALADLMVLYRYGVFGRPAESP
jgi:hypothetical protein